MLEVAINNDNTIDIQIPEELQEYVLQKTEICGKFLTVRTKGNSTHPFARLMGFYVFLKAISPGSSLIQNYSSQIADLSQKYKCSRRSFFSYVRELKEMKLITKEGKNLRIASWQQLGKILNISTNRKTKIQFNYDDKQKIHWWFAALDIKSNQERQQYMIWKKVNKHSDAKNELLTAMRARGFDYSKLNNPEYFSDRLFALYVEDFRTGTEVHNLLINIRSDVNRSVKKLANDWCISPQLTSYWKKKMRLQKIIDVAKIQVVSEWTRSTNECHKNKFCHVIWNDKLKERVWFLCDQISVLMPWKWQEFLKNIKAA